MHAQLPTPIVTTNFSAPLDGAPMILDWAFETRPGTAILAGARAVPVPLAAPHVTQSGMLRIAWQSQPNVAYQIQFKDRLDAPLWTNVGVQIIASTNNSMMDVPTADASRFFRVVTAN